MVKYDNLEVNPGAENPFQSVKQNRVSVIVLAEVRAGLLGVNQTHLAPFLKQVGQHAQERPLADIKVFYIGRTYPE
jgi:hypothetical protein